MSVLDLLTGALGAFCFLTLALFPSYYKMRVVGAEAKKTQSSNSTSPNPRKKIQREKTPRAANTIPQFAFLQLASSNSQNRNCAAFRIQSAQGPPGSPNLDYRATETDPKVGVLAYDLFAFRAGRYRLLVDATPYGSGCTAAVIIVKAQPKVQTRPLTRTGPVEFDFQITPNDFSKSLFH